MVYRTVICVVFVGVPLAASCGLFGDPQKPLPSENTASESQAGSAPPVSQTGSASVVGYHGPMSLEERIFASPVIARVRLESVSSTIESGPYDGTTKYIPLLEFNFTVLEHLKGSGPSSIVALWESRPVFDTRAEAEAALPAVVAARDSQWDAREAIVFLQQSIPYLSSTQQAQRFHLSWAGSIGPPDDWYSIASRHQKQWLPTEAAGGAPSSPVGDQQRFLLDVPPVTGTVPTITLGEMKNRIAAVAAKLNAGDGSPEFRECVRRTYQYEGMDHYSLETRGHSLFVESPDHELDSGLAASTIVYENSDLGGLPDKRDELWLDGGDAELFGVEFGDSVPYDFSGDGTNDSIQYAQRVAAARPLPAGAYKFYFNHRDGEFVPCDGYTIRYEWTVTVTAPEGTLHELFFDPVNQSGAVKADDTNGVLKPEAFTDSNGGSVTIESISYEASTVKVEVTPNAALAGQIVDFIELDGTVSLSLDVADATVDPSTGSGQSGALSWSVSSQPWEDGDPLMVRIREAR